MKLDYNIYTILCETSFPFIILLALCGGVCVCVQSLAANNSQ